jgi:ElaB/YqjD/DUF883 family membrane-anchored ribosome-binding protein
MNKSKYSIVLALLVSTLFVTACSDNDSEAETADQKLDAAIATSKTTLEQIQEETSELYEQAADASKETLNEAEAMLDKASGATSDTYDKVADKSGKFMEQGKDEASELTDDAKASSKEGSEKVKGMMDSEDKDS